MPAAASPATMIARRTTRSFFMDRKAGCERYSRTKFVTIAAPSRGESMQISMYQASVPPMIRALNNLAAVLEKGAQHCEAKKIDPSVMINARLFPDMFPLRQQVQIASDTAKAGGARLAGMEPPSYTDDETTFAQLIERTR